MTEQTGYWLLITTRGVWKQLQHIGIWGFGERLKGKIKMVRDGDLGLVYLTADGGIYESAIGGIVELSKNVKMIEKMVSPFDALYPLRMSIHVREIFEPPLPFRPLINTLTFIRIKRNYGANLQGQALKEISLEDFITIKGAWKEKK